MAKGVMNGRELSATHRIPPGYRPDTDRTDAIKVYQSHHENLCCAPGVTLYYGTIPGSFSPPLILQHSWVLVHEGRRDGAAHEAAAWPDRIPGTREGASPLRSARRTRRSFGSGTAPRSSRTGMSTAASTSAAWPTPAEIRGNNNDSSGSSGGRLPFPFE
jgi:hypothetical protein